MRRWLSLIACWIPLASAAARTAPPGRGLGGDEEAPSSRLMLYGPGTDDTARLVAETLLVRMDRLAALPEQTLAAAQAVPPMPPGGMLIGGDVLVQRCAGEPVAADAWLEVVDRGRSLFTDLEYEAALEAFREAEDLLPCLVGLLPAGSLSDLYFTSGLAAFYVEGPAEAREAFAHALSADPTRPWDDRYPPAPQQVFLDAGKEVLHAPPRPLVVLDPGGAIQHLRVDGADRDPAGVGVAELAPGTHLAQWALADGAVHSALVEIVPGGQLVLLTREGYLDAVLDGGRDAALGRVVAPRLTQLAVDHGADRLVIVRTGDGAQVSLFDPARQTFEITERERFRNSVEEQRRRWGPRGGLSLGGGFLTIIAPGDDWDFQYGALTVNGEFRIIAGLYVDIAATVGLRRGEIERDSIVVLPSSRMGVKYAPVLRSLRPFFGIAGQTTVYGRDDVALGGGLLAGMALEFPRNPSLRMGFEIFGGRIRNWTLQVVGHVGVAY